MKYPTLCKVEYWDDNQMRTDNCLIYADSFTAAAQQIEEYYGDEIESLSIQMFDIGMWRVPEEFVKRIVEEM